jgi:hypothetical protein
MEWRSHVILPIVVADPVLEYGFVVGALADVEDPVLLRMSLVQKSLNLHFNDKQRFS